ncbi:MAG: C40 family peptidase [Actinomycetota bacterium]|jgi:cell wall-associated NlpC family hydrolase|nr:C40 family peptidase [Actinomycetota bacterium]
MEGITSVTQRIAEIEARLRELFRAGTYPPGMNQVQAPEGASTVFSPFGTYLQSSLNGVGEAVVQEAGKFLGVPYVYGGATPSGFDCSGLVQYVFRKFGVELPHYTVTQAQRGTPVSRSELRPGDVIFFGENGGRGFLYHVGIYIGGNRFIHAPHTGDVVKISELVGKYDRNFACARRYL